MQPAHSRLAAALLAAAAGAALSSAFVSSASAADLRVYGSVVTGLYYTDFQNGTTQAGVAGKGITPGDSSVHVEGREDLSDNLYVGFNLGPKFSADDGTLFQNGKLFNASRLVVGTKDIEFAFGGVAGLTVVGEPYSSYARLNANMAQAQTDGIAPACITFQPGDLTNTIAFSTPMGKPGFFVSGLYTNGDAATENTYEWSDVRHVAQFSSGWIGKEVRAGFVYSFEMPGDMPTADGSRANPSLGILGVEKPRNPKQGKGCAAFDNFLLVAMDQSCSSTIGDSASWSEPNRVPRHLASS